MPDLDRFAAWLKHRRIALNFTRSELAQRAHCSASTLRRLEAGDLRASEQLAASLAKALNVPADQIESFVRFTRGESIDPALFDLPAGARVSSPPDRSPTPHNLPAPLTSLVGRKRDSDTVCELLQEPGVRLLTLTGPPGTGKTRLSIAAAQQLIATTRLFPDGAWFVPLAPIGDPALVADTLAQVLGVRETSGEILSPLREFLRSKHLLLVLDNFEQIVDAAPLITDLLTNAPHLKAMVTSRAVLHVYGEHEYPVPPLALPDAQRLPTTQALSFYARFASVQLFKDRARAVKPDFQLTTDNAADVARICAWLDGLPLAIEMAAAQVKWLPLPKLLEQLSNRLAALTGGPIDLSPRQQSLTGAIDWSYHLLDPIEQRLLEVLGVFSGGCDEEALAECGLRIVDGKHDGASSSISHQQSTIRNLVEKSLLRYEVAADGQTRYSLYEMIRDYARAKLDEQGQLDRARQIHAEHYYRLAQSARPHVTQGSEQVNWINRLEVEHNNLRAALTWSLESADRAEFAYRLAEALHDFWQIRGHLSEGRRWQEQVLASEADPSAVRAQLLSNVGQLARMQGDYVPAHAALEQALIIQRQLNDAAGECRSLEQLAILAGSQGDYARARDLLEQTLEKRRALGDERAAVVTMNNLAIATRRLKDFARAEQLYAECATLSRVLHDQRSLARALYGLGEVRTELDDYAEGLRYFRESLKIRQQLGSRPEIITALGGTGMAYFCLGDAVTAATIIAASEKHRQDLGMAIAQGNRLEVEESIAQVREKAGAAFDAAWAKGRSLSLDEAVEVALQTDGDSSLADARSG